MNPAAADDAGVAFGEPAIYRIRVQGHLDSRMSADIGDVEIEEADGSKTSLRVRVLDQAALSGVLEALYELHLSILSVDVCAEGDKKSCDRK